MNPPVAAALHAIHASDAAAAAHAHALSVAQKAMAVGGVAPTVEAFFRLNLRKAAVWNQTEAAGVREIARRLAADPLAGYVPQVAMRAPYLMFSKVGYDVVLSRLNSHSPGSKGVTNRIAAGVLMGLPVSLIATLTERISDELATASLAGGANARINVRRMLQGMRDRSPTAGLPWKAAREGMFVMGIAGIDVVDGALEEHLGMRQGPARTVAASAISGFTMAILSQPFDTISTLKGNPANPNQPLGLLLRQGRAEHGSVPRLLMAGWHWRSLQTVITVCIIGLAIQGVQRYAQEHGWQ